MALWHAEHTLDTNAEPAAIWKWMSAVSQWPEWDPGLAWAELQGPFSAGSQGRLRLAGDRARTFRILSVDPERRFTAQIRLPLMEIRHLHSQEASDLGTRLTHRVEVSGLLAPLFGLFLGRRLRAGLAPSMRNLARLACKA